MASMDERQYERFAAFNSGRISNRPLKKVITGRAPRAAYSRWHCASSTAFNAASALAWSCLVLPHRGTHSW